MTIENTLAQEVNWKQIFCPILFFFQLETKLG